MILSVKNLLVVSLALLLRAGCVASWSHSHLLDRRSAVSVATGSAAWIATQPAVAVDSGTLALETFQDSKTGVSVKVPSGWTPSVQTLPDRRTLNLWTDPNDNKSLLFIAFTPVRDDFTSLGSFGSVDQVAVQTILPKGKLAGFNVEAEMLKATSAKQAYFFDYLQTVPNVQPTTHFRTIFTLQQGATGGAGAVLVTITAQTPESRYQSELKGVFDQVMDSYKTGGKM